MSRAFVFAHASSTEIYILSLHDALPISADEFRQAGVDYSATVPRVRTAVERRPDGRYFIVLTTAQPVEERFLDRLSGRSEEHTSELQSLRHLVCRLLLGKKNKTRTQSTK